MAINFMGVYRSREWGYSSEHRLYCLGGLDMEARLQLANAIGFGMRLAQKAKKREVHEALYADLVDRYGSPLSNREVQGVYSDWRLALKIGGGGVILTCERLCWHPITGRAVAPILFDAGIAETIAGEVFIRTQSLDRLAIDPSFLYEIGERFGRRVELREEPKGYTALVAPHVAEERLARVA